uniref:Uncharacterized protein n=1 Tax=Plectus sambesii TaxID=2011161 RepID=A0A914WWD4_9BILA
MGSLRSFSPDSSDDERTTIHSVHSPSVASSLSVGPVSGISSIVRNGETRQFRSGGQKVSAPARNEARFTAGMSSDRDGLLMGFRAVEERFEQLIDGRGHRVTAEEIVELQSATDTYTQLLNLKREQLRGDGALRSQTFGALGRGENVVESSKRK